jgi:hypothetical protein
MPLSKHGINLISVLYQVAINLATEAPIGCRKQNFSECETPAMELREGLEARSEVRFALHVCAE